MIITKTSKFQRIYKKLKNNQIVDVDNAIRFIAENPDVGQQKRGDLSQVRVYKFMCVNQLMLLAYAIEDNYLVLTILDLGSHENFYRDLKR